MRIIVVLAVSVGAFWAIDSFAFAGRYRATAWQEAKYQGQVFNYRVQSWLNRKGL